MTDVGQGACNDIGMANATKHRSKSCQYCSVTKKEREGGIAVMARRYQEIKGLAEFTGMVYGNVVS